jgi:hypothetical protein
MFSQSKNSGPTGRVVTTNSIKNTWTIMEDRGVKVNWCILGGNQLPVEPDVICQGWSAGRGRISLGKSIYIVFVFNMLSVHHLSSQVNLGQVVANPGRPG